MSFVQNLIDAWKVVRHGYWHSGRYYPPFQKHIEAQRAYKNAHFVKLAVNKIMGTVGMATPVVKELRDGKYIEVEQLHPLQVLMNYPNPEVSRSAFQKQVINRLLMEGNAIIILQGKGKRPDEMSILPTKYMSQTINDDNGEVTDYVYQPYNGASIHFPTDQVVHLKLFDPDNYYWGLSMISATMYEINADFNMAQWNENFFGPRNAIPLMAVEIMGNQTTQEFDRLRQDWYNRGGMQRETIFFRSGVGFNRTKLHPIGMTPMEIAFIAGRQWNRKSIYELFGIPEALMDKDATEASSITAERTYYQNVWEYLTDVASGLNNDIAPFYMSRGDYRGKIKIEYKDIRPINEELKLKEIETSKDHMSINEIRERFWEMPNVEWGDLPAKGSGAARMMFPQQGGFNRALDDGRDKQNNPLPGQEPPPPEEANPQTRQPREVKMIQRDILDAIKDGTLDVDAIDLHDLPPAQADYLRDGLKTAQTPEDILLLFDPLFENSRRADIKAEQDNRRWTETQVAKLPSDQRRSVIIGANDIYDAFGVASRIENLVRTNSN